MSKKDGYYPGVGVRAFDEKGNVVMAAGDLSGLPFGDSVLPEGSSGVYVPNAKVEIPSWLRDD